MSTTTTAASAHLSDADVERLGAELDAIRAEVMADLGDDDARYVRRVIAVQRGLDTSGRVLLQFSRATGTGSPGQDGAGEGSGAPVRAGTDGEVVDAAQAVDERERRVDEHAGLRAG